MNEFLASQRLRTLDAMGLGPVWVRRPAHGVDVPVLARSDPPDAAPARACDVVVVGVEHPVCAVIADPTAAGQAERFEGPAGRLLDAMLASIGLSRATNASIVAVVPVAFDGTSTAIPDRDWRDALDRGLATLAPTMILVVGTKAAARLHGGDPTTRDPLRLMKVDGRAIPLVITVDPTHLLERGADKAAAWRDLCLARERCDADAARVAALKSTAPGASPPALR